MKNPQLDPEIAQWYDSGKFYCYKGYDLFYKQEGKGENLLILHGYPYASFEWKYVWDDLAAHYNVLAIDFLGMGFSQKPENYAYSFKDHVAAVNEIANYLNIKDLHILSHDLGVSVAQELLAMDRQYGNAFKIHSVAFCNGGLFMDAYKPRFIQRLLSQSPDFIGKIISRIICKAKIDQSVKSLFGKQTQPDPKLMDQLWTLLNYNGGKRISYLIGRLVFDKVNHQKSWIGAMQQTEIAMCYICGPADPNSGLHMAKRYGELIPNPKIYLLPHGIGHWPHIEDTRNFLGYYRKFRTELNFSTIGLPQHPLLSEVNP